jgi:hypothetical protein
LAAVRSAEALHCSVSWLHSWCWRVTVSWVLSKTAELMASSRRWPCYRAGIVRCYYATTLGSFAGCCSTVRSLVASWASESIQRERRSSPDASWLDGWPFQPSPRLASTPALRSAASCPPVVSFERGVAAGRSDRFLYVEAAARPHGQFRSRSFCCL